MNQEANVDVRYRPLGLMLAIFIAVILFAVLPLLKFYVSWRLNRGIEQDGIIFGASLPFDGFTWLTGLLGILVFVAAIFAWYGRPPMIRFIFQFMVLLAASALIGETIYRAVSETTITISSEQSLQNVLRQQIPLQILSTLYIIWYCNRAPSRNFYRP